MPNPKATTEACSRSLARELLSERKGCSTAKPKAIPPASAMAGEKTPRAARRRPMKKAVLLCCIAWSLPGTTFGVLTDRVQTEIVMRHKGGDFRLCFAYA